MAGRPSTPDFRSLDFTRLWSGRDRVTEVEARVLTAELASAQSVRVLEVGAGSGRLSPVIQGMASEFVTLDVTPEFLARVPVGNGQRALRVAANAYHLPFADQAFAAAVMVRVLGFLAQPLEALREVRRVLGPGGRLVVSYNPRPSLATLVDDLKVGLSLLPRERMESMTFSRRSVVPVRPSSFPAWSMTRSEFRRTIASAGFTWLLERPTGLEDFPVFRRLPADTFVSLSSALADAGGFPTRFALVRRPGDPPEQPVAWESLLSCPACLEPLGSPPAADNPAWACSRCGRTWPRKDGIVDLRWFGEPEGGSGA